jgi:hypothetical protein
MARVGIAEVEGETRTELPKEFVDHCTRLTKMEQRVQKLVPYVPLLRMPYTDSLSKSLGEKSLALVTLTSVLISIVLIQF